MVRSYAIVLNDIYTQKTFHYHLASYVIGEGYACSDSASK